MRDQHLSALRISSVGVISGLRRIIIAMEKTYSTPLHLRHLKSGKKWPITVAVIVCLFIALYGCLGLDSLLVQTRKSVSGVLLSNQVDQTIKQPLEQGIVLEVQDAEEELPIREESTVSAEEDFCAGRYIYVYDLPDPYNTDLVNNCKRDKHWEYMCEDVTNGGLGEEIVVPENGSLSSILQPRDAWYSTSQFTVEMLFHERLKTYPCLTNDSNKAIFSYIPFYTALDLSTTIFQGTAALRDKLSQRLIGWLQSHEHWKATGGRSHVIVLGRIIWDYARKVEKETDWGNAFLSFPEVENVTKLSIEKSPWCTDQMAIPYPTSYHPYSERQIQAWQRVLETSKRDTLVLFAGAPRNNSLSGSLRGALMEQCQNSTNCNLLSCREVNCVRNPEVLTEKFLKSVFCLQPSGDSATRKGVFDCLVAGSIPVFFDERTAYNQYLWHLPSNGSSYSVFLDHAKVVNGTLDVIKELKKIPQQRIRSMQKAVRELMPGVVYRKVGILNGGIKDAFDLTIDNLLEKFKSTGTVS